MPTAVPWVPTAAAPVAILCWPILVPGLGPGSCHPCVVCPVPCPCSRWGGLSPEIPLPTPLRPAQQCSTPAPPNSPKPAQKPKQERDICSQRRCWNFSQWNFSTAWTAPAGAVINPPAVPCSSGISGLHQPLLSPRLALCAALWGRLSSCLWGYQSPAGDRATRKWLWVKMQLQAGEIGGFLEATSRPECEYCALLHLGWALLGLAPANPALVQGQVKLLN